MPDFDWKRPPAALDTTLIEGGWKTQLWTPNLAVATFILGVVAVTGASFAPAIPLLGFDSYSVYPLFVLAWSVLVLVVFTRMSRALGLRLELTSGGLLWNGLAVDLPAGPPATISRSTRLGIYGRTEVLTLELGERRATVSQRDETLEWLARAINTVRDANAAESAEA